MVNDMHAADPIDAPPTHLTSDVSDRRVIHEVIRGSNRRLVAGIASTAVGDRRRVRALRRWFTGYAVELRARSGDEHAELHDLIERLEAVLLLWSEQPHNEVAADRALVLAMAVSERFIARLDVEDAHILERIWFSLPWSVSGMDADSRKATLHAAPLRHKFGYRLTRRRYDRLVARAFGDRASAWEANGRIGRSGELDERPQESSDLDEIFGELVCV